MMDENKMAEKVVANLGTRVFGDLEYVRCPNCGGIMVDEEGGPSCEMIDEGDPRFVEIIGFRCETCNAHVVITQVFEPVPESLEAAMFVDEVYEEWR